MERYRFALKPRWIASHVFVAFMVVVFVAAGFWQLDRLDQKRERNARITERSEQDAVPVQELAVDPGAFDEVDGIEYRAVTATGTYAADDQVLAGSPTLNGSPGSWVLAPLVLDDGTAVLVNRGWIPDRGDLEDVPDDVTTPEGTVTVEGWVIETETKGAFGGADPSDGRLTRLARADVARIDQQVDADLLPFTLQLRDQDPALGDDDPEPMPLPELSEGPHLSYAGQWFIFAILTVVFYPLILRRRAREIEREQAAEAVSDPAAG